MQAWLGDLLFSMGNVDEAVRHLSLAVEVAPEKPFHHFRLGLGYLNIGDRDQARAWFLKVVDLDPTSELAGQSREFLADLKNKKDRSPHQRG